MVQTSQACESSRHLNWAATTIQTSLPNVSIDLYYLSVKRHLFCCSCSLLARSFLKWSEDFSLHFGARATDELFCSIIAHFFINNLTHFFSLLICSFQLFTTQRPHQAPASDSSSQHHSKEPKTNGQEEDNQREKSLKAMKCSLCWTCQQRLKMWQMFGLIAWQRSGG